MLKSSYFYSDKIVNEYVCIYKLMVMLHVSKFAASISAIIHIR